MPRSGWAQRASASKPDDPPGGQRHDRLVLDAELAALQRPVEVVAGAQAAHHRGPRRGVEALDPVAAPLLGPVHGGVGVLHQALAAEALAVGDGDADAGAHVGVAVDQRHGVAHHLPHAVGLGQDLGVARGVDHQHGELVAAEAGHGVDRARRALQAMGDDAQQLVAGGVAEAVVHDLEAVEVEQHHRHPVDADAGAVEGPLQPVHEVRPVAQAGELVVAGRVLEPLGDGLALRDVLDLTDDELAAVGLVDEGERHRRPHDAAVGADVALLHARYVPSASRSMSRKSWVLEGPVVGVGEIGERAPGELVGAVARASGRRSR